MKLNFWNHLFKTDDHYTYNPFENGVEVLNFWPGQASKDLWLYQFVTARFGDMLNKENSLLLASLFGRKSHIRKSPSRTKLFFSGENLARFPKYRDYCADVVDLAIGFDDIRRPGYVRFPLWLLFLFEPASNYDTIKARVENISRDIPNIIPGKQQFCSLICSHDKNGNREKLFHLINAVGKVDSAGKYLNNTNALKQDYNDNKVDFLRQYRFNICPENTNRHGYVTEKVFEAIMCGCIPIYWGAGNHPEPQILNREAILFYDERNPQALSDRVKTLQGNTQAYTDFAMQERFLPGAADRIHEMFAALEQGIRERLAKHG